MKNAVVRGVWRALRFVGAERLSWNLQYRASYWTADHAPRSQHLLAIINEHAPDYLVEFGCGEGGLADQVERFARYQGYDISDEAVRCAAPRPNCSVTQMDMRDWNGDSNVDMAVLEECLYYLDEPAQRRFLKTLGSSLAADGRAVVIVHSRTKHRRTIDVVRSELPILDERDVEQRVFLVVGPPAGPADRQE